MSIEDKYNNQIDEFLEKTQDEDNGERKIPDVSRVGKYKKRRKAEIIVFPDVTKKKTVDNSKPMDSKNIDDLTR